VPRLRFHASSVEIEPDAERVSFATEDDSHTFSFQRDDSAPDEGPLWIERDEQAHAGRAALLRVVVEAGRFTADVDLARAPFFAPYDGVEVLHDDDDDTTRALVAALARIFRGHLSRVRVNVEGLPSHLPEPGAQQGPPRKKGLAMLAAKSPGSAAWSGRAGKHADFTVVVENGGGPLTRGVTVELGGPAMTSGLVDAVQVKTPSGVVAFERAGDVALAPLAALTLEACAEPQEGERAMRRPSVSLTVRVHAAKAGRGLLTVRVLREDGQSREGSGMVGRSIVIEPT